MEDGINRMEIDFPYIEAIVDEYAETADAIVRQNVGVAIKLAQELNKADMKVYILSPDDYDLELAMEQGRVVSDYSEGQVTLGHCREILAGPILKALSLFKDPVDMVPKAAKDADFFIAINLQSPDAGPLRNYVDTVVGDKPIALVNCGLDKIRAKLGIIGFPPKTQHTEFLCQFKPVFFMNFIDYNQRIMGTTEKLNVKGALYRQYPGPYQLMYLDSTKKALVEVEYGPDRYTVTETYTKIRRARGITDELARAEFTPLQQQQLEWYEQDLQSEESSAWRT